MRPELFLQPASSSLVLTTAFFITELKRNFRNHCRRGGRKAVRARTGGGLLENVFRACGTQELTQL